MKGAGQRMPSPHLPTYLLQRSICVQLLTLEHEQDTAVQPGDSLRIRRMRRNMILFGRMKYPGSGYSILRKFYPPGWNILSAG